MKTYPLRTLVAALLSATVLGHAQTLPPTTIHYQGRVSVAGASVEGTGYFKFLLYAPDKRLWSNDDSHTGSEALGVYEPSGNVSVGVAGGLFSADLGSATMPAITSSVLFDGSSNVRSEVYLRIWFSSAATGPFVKLSPDRRLSSVPFALVAGTVVKGAITHDKLANSAVGNDTIAGGAVTVEKLAADAITRVQIKDGEVTQGKLSAGSVDSGAILDGSVSTGDLAGNVFGGVETIVGAVTSDKIKDGTILSRDVAADGIAPDRLQRDVAVFADVRPIPSDGGPATTGWQLRTLNTTETNLAGAQSLISRTGDTIILQPGTYYVRGSCPAFGVAGHQAVLRDTTGSPSNPVVALRGTSESSNYTSGGDYADSRSQIEGVVVVTGQSHTYQLWHYCAQTGFGNQGFGLSAFSASATQESNVYSRISIIRLK